MKYWFCFFLILGFYIPAFAADYKICTMKNEGDYICNSREKMRLFLQAVGTDDKVTQQQLRDAGDCGPAFAKDIKEIQEYDVVKAPVATHDGLIYVEIAWVKIQSKTGKDFHDYFMAQGSLTCK